MISIIIIIIPAHFDASAALQGHSVARFFAGHWLCGLNMVPTIV